MNEHGFITSDKSDFILLSKIKLISPNELTCLIKDLKMEIKI
jgi:hypothetical protein